MKAPHAMSPTLVLPFGTRPDLAATMDIQIPALAWQPVENDRYRRAYHLNGRRIEVTVWADDHQLCFALGASSGDAVNDEVQRQIERILRATFPVQIADLDLGTHPILTTLHERYAGVVVMWADPFEALVLTMLSQNRSGETVRQVYPQLADATGGATPAGLVACGEERLREVIRSAGPYKAPRLFDTAVLVAASGGRTVFADRLAGFSPREALADLVALPGVAHKTAACVLVFATRTRATLPVDVHLFRVTDRLGLVDHDGRNTTATREALIARLLAHARDVALAHFVFLLVGRTTCTATAPACGDCFLSEHCRHATTEPPDPLPPEAAT
jgi:endonuclease III